jgi:hypothetical protein
LDNYEFKFCGTAAVAFMQLVKKKLITIFKIFLLTKLSSNVGGGGGMDSVSDQ